MNATTPPTPHTVGILAGMGPAAGVDFARLFVAACEDWLRGHGQAVCDQAYPAHWMAQLPIADRTRALTDGAAPQPLGPLLSLTDQRPLPLLRLFSTSVRLTMAMSCARRKSGVPWGMPFSARSALARASLGSPSKL